jgi:hypothetical protein
MVLDVVYVVVNTYIIAMYIVVVREANGPVPMAIRY